MSLSAASISKIDIFNICKIDLVIFKYAHMQRYLHIFLNASAVKRQKVTTLPCSPSCGFYFSPCISKQSWCCGLLAYKSNPRWDWKSSLQQEENPRGGFRLNPAAGLERSFWALCKLQNLSFQSLEDTRFSFPWYSRTELGTGGHSRVRKGRCQSWCKKN